MTPSSPLDVTVLVARALERAGIPYFLGGSMATSLQGEPRATNDIDFVIDLPESRVVALENALGPDFEVDAPSLVEAVRRKSSWNIFHLPSVTKIDLFVRKTSPFDTVEFERRRHTEILPGTSIFLKTPEDSVLRKLLWFRQGGEVSSSQWRDVVEVLRVSCESVDRAYLDRWAAEIQVQDLLQRAMNEARLRR